MAPGAINVISGRVEFPVELRDLDAAKIVGMWEHIQQRFVETDKAENVETRCSLLDRLEPARADPNLQSAIREAAKSLGLATADLPSLAGQDAQEIARIAPMAMIFVPSKDGISHSPKEFTSWRDVANGTEVLKVVDTPFGKRPFRVHVDPTQDGAEVVNMVLDRVRAPPLRRCQPRHWKPFRDPPGKDCRSARGRGSVGQIAWPDYAYRGRLMSCPVYQTNSPNIL